MLITPQLSVAWETDQFTLPTRPLVDVGPTVSRYVVRKLELALDEVNTVLAQYPNELVALRRHHYAQRNFVLSYNPRFRHRSRANRINQLRRDIEQREQALRSFSTLPGIAAHISAAIGRPIAVQEKIDGIFGLPTDFALESTDGESDFASYFRPTKTGSVYSFAGFHRGAHASYFIFSSTINLHGFEVGMDKLGHFFNEGHGYYEQYAEVYNHSGSHNDAVQAAVEWGKRSEAGRFGLYASGVYSNGDLAANVSGLHFYLNLFAPIELSGKRYPAIVERVDGSYRLASYYKSQPDTFLARFYSNHMNEALNPSRLEKLQFVAIKPAITSRCAQWQQRFPERDAGWYSKQQQELQRWHGIDYGQDSQNAPLLSNLCFSEHK